MPLKAWDTAGNTYSAIISSFKVENNSQNGQKPVLANWETSNGSGAPSPIYKSPGPLDAGASAPLITEDEDLPFLQCLTQLDRGAPQIQVTYQLTVSIYQNGNFQSTYSWDPFVTVYRSS